jgi:Na+-driven multidrug efflux pump
LFVTLDKHHLWRHALALAGPAVGLQGLNLLVSLTGRWLAGNAEMATAADQLALQGAQTTCFYLAWMIGSFGILASAGATALVARLVGAGDRDGANRAMHQAVLVALAVGVAGWLLGAFGVDGLLALLNLDGTAASYAQQFLRAMLLLLPFQLLTTTLNASLAGSGDTRTPLKIAVGTTAANLPLAWVGFRGLGDWPGLGLAGIAWGAGISQALGTVVLLGLLAHGRSGLRLELSLLAPDRGPACPAVAHQPASRGRKPGDGGRPDGLSVGRQSAGRCRPRGPRYRPGLGVSF